MKDPAAERARLLENLRLAPSGIDWCRAHTTLVDSVIRGLHDRIAGKYASARVAVVATGGYGRRELAPFSDVDLTVIPLDESDPETDPLVRDLFLALQDEVRAGLGLEVGYALRLINDAPGLDAVTRSALLDARLVSGASEPLDRLMEKFWATFPVADFLLAKISERQSSLDKTNDTPLVVEPNLKLGAGGIRCLQTANWIKAALGERPVFPAESFELVLAARNLLHAISGRANDVLTRQRQAEIADVLGRDPFSYMSDLCSAGLEIHAEYRAGLQRIHETRFPLAKGILAIRGELRSGGMPDAGLAAATVAVATDLGLRVGEVNLQVSDAIDGASAVFAVGRGEKSIRNLDKCGLLGKLLPELAACRTLMPRDSAHRFTVFEHTLRVVRNLDRSLDHPWLRDLRTSLPETGILYLGALLHDVGKIEEGKRHSEAGAQIAAEVCQRWGLSESTTAQVVWLVREHLTLARFIRMRDVGQPQTARDLAAVVEDIETLDMLALLTWADVNAVSEEAWTPVQDTFLKELYLATAELLQGADTLDERPADLRRRLLRHLKSEVIDPAETDAFLASLPTEYLVGTSPEAVRIHMHLARQVLDDKPGTVDVASLLDSAASEVTVVCQDQPGLLSKILGVLYAHDLSLHAIRAATTRTDKPIAIDRFTVSFGGREIPPASATSLISNLTAAIGGSLKVETLLTERGKNPDRSQQVFQFTVVPGHPAILEIQAPRGRGMAYRFSRVLARNGWNITAARVGQWAGQGAAAFYLTAEDGSPLDAGEIEKRLTSQV